jgi:electron transfer flavoprotein beta subunit
MKPMRKIAWSEIEAKVGNNQQVIERLYLPVRQKKTEMLTGAPAEVARTLVDRLKNQARAL